MRYSIIISNKVSNDHNIKRRQSAAHNVNYVSLAKNIIKTNLYVHRFQTSQQFCDQNDYFESLEKINFVRKIYCTTV